MKTLLAALAAVVLVCFSHLLPARAQVGGLNSFYGENTRGVKNASDLAARFSDPRLSHVPRNELVEAFNIYVGVKIHHRVGSFGELMSYVQSRAFVVLPCEKVFPSGWFPTVGQRTADGVREYVPFLRHCYWGERLLVHRNTGIVAFSLICGNLGNSTMVAYVMPPGRMPTSAIEETCPVLGWSCFEQNRPAGSGWNLTDPQDQPSVLHGPLVLSPPLPFVPY